MQGKSDELCYRVSVQLTAGQYAAAVLAAQRRIGYLRHAPFLYLLAFLLVFSGGTSLFYRVTAADSIVLAAVFVLSGMTIFLLVGNLLPKRIQERAAETFAAGAIRKKPKTVDFCRDGYFVTAQNFQASGYYAEQLLCLETKELIVLVTDYSGRVLVVPKAACQDLEGLLAHLKRQMGQRYRTVK